jgi:HlyB family type I secretion system ABC transporter
LRESSVTGILDRVGVVAALSEEQRAAIAELGQLRSYRAGDCLVKSGGILEGLYVLVSGRLRVVDDRRYATPVALDVLSEGGCFGETGLFAEETSDFSVVADSDVAVYMVPGSGFRELCAQRNDIQRALDGQKAGRAIRDFLKSSTVFSALSSAQLDRLTSSMARRTVQAGEILIRQGDRAEEVYVVESGRFSVYREEEPGKPVATLQSGSIAGEIAVLSGGRRTATVRADSGGDVFAIPGSTFLELVESQGRFGASIDALAQTRRQAAAAETKATEAEPGEADETLHWKQPPLAQPLHRLRHFPAIRQQSTMDCGAACLCTVCYYYGKRVDLNRMRDMAKVGQAGASMLHLVQALDLLGFECIPMLATYEHLGNNQLPAIVNWKGYHWMVVYEVTKDWVLAADPGRGITRIRKDEFLKGYTRYTIYLRPTQRFRDLEESKPALRQFYGYVRPYRRLLVEIGLASLVVQLLSLLLPMFTKFIIDDVIVRQDERWLFPALVAMAAAVVLKAGASWARQSLVLFVSLRLNLGLVSDFYQHLLRLPLPFFERRKTGDITSRFAENEKITSFFTGAGVDSVIDAITAVLYLALMLYYSLPLALVSIVFLGLHILNIRVVYPRLAQAYREAFQSSAENQSLLVESLAGLRTIKVLGVQHFIRWRWEDLLVRLINTYFKTTRYMIAAGLAGQLVSNASSVSVLFYGAMLVLDGQLTIGTLVAFMTLVKQVNEPVVKLVGVGGQFQETLNAVERLNDVLDSAPEIPSARSEDRVALKHLRGHIRFDNVTFRYFPDGKNVLQNVSLVIEPGQRIAFVGRSGSGKSTLVKLLLGFYPVSSGRIYLDGFEISRLWLPSLRQQIGVVPQESFLFCATVRDNIGQARPGARLSTVIEAAKHAGAHDFIAALPNGYETLLEERGANLSGGQRQRVAIARAVLQQPRMLILDEATSALDNESERHFLHSLDAAFGGRTVIAIAHRLSTVRNFDRIVVLDSGNIVEQGTHDELMSRRGLYYFLCSQQLSM